MKVSLNITQMGEMPNGTRESSQRRWYSLKSHWEVLTLCESAHHVLCVCALVSQWWPTLCNPWTVAHQAPLSMEFSGQEYWSGLPFPSPGDLPDPGTVPTPLAAPALAGGFFATAHLGSPHTVLLRICLQRFPKEMMAFSVLSLVLLWQCFSRGVVLRDSAVL